MLSVPTVISGESYSLETDDPTERLTALLNFQGDLLWVSLVSHT